jgi:endonuclease G
MTPDDPFHRNDADELEFQVPAGFWKVMVVPHRGARTVAAFLVWQRDHDSEHPVSFAPFLEQVRLTTIEFLTGLSFPALRHLDPQRFGERTRSLAPPGAPRSGPLNSILSPNDIVL